MSSNEKAKRTGQNKPDNPVRKWRCKLGLLSWGCLFLTAIFSSAVAVVSAGAVIQPLVPKGSTGDAVSFIVALVVTILGVLGILMSGHGKGAIWGSKLFVPPAWLVSACTVVLFWICLLVIGVCTNLSHHLTIQPSVALAAGVFTHSKLWLWGALVACICAVALWRAVIVRLLAWTGKRLNDSGLNVVLPPQDIFRETGNQCDETESCPMRDEWSPVESWLRGNDWPLQAGQKTLFQTEPSPQRIIAGLRPRSVYGPAGTLALIGPRGSGKSSLLRLSEGTREAKDGVELRFVYLSLWEYKTAQAAVQAMVEVVIRSVRDRIDIFPFTGAAEAFLRAINGDGRLRWFADALALRSGSGDTFEAISTLLLFNKLRVIICIEDDDRLKDTAQGPEIASVVTGSLDFFRQFPGLGYVLCIGSRSWDDLCARATKVNNIAEEREKVHLELYKNTNARPNKAQPAGGTKVFSQNLDNAVMLDGAVSRSASSEQLMGFDTARLCGEELVIPPLRFEQWKPIVTTIRNRMLSPNDNASKSSTAHFHLGDTDRNDSWNKFLEAVKSTQNFHLSYNDRMSFTPRTLRRGLRDAWRKWSVIVPQLGDKLIIDPDSVLVACLLRASRPDVWNTLIRDDELLEGGQWPTLTIAAEPQEGELAISKLPYGEPIRWLCLHPAIRNMLLKQAPIPALWGGEGDGPEFKRPGGLIGKLDDDEKPGTNWRIFLNA